MRLAYHLRAAALTLACGVAAPAAAQTLNFADVALPSTGIVVLGSSYTTQGYRFGCVGADTGATCSSLSVTGPTYFAGNGRSEQALFNNNIYGVTTLAREDGAAFDLLSWRLGPLFNQRAAPNVVVEGTLASGGTVTQSFVVPVGGTGFTEFAFGTAFRALRSVRWSVDGFSTAWGGNAEYVATIVAAPSATAVVPEPAAAALAAAGLAGLAAGARRPARRRRPDAA